MTDTQAALAQALGADFEVLRRIGEGSKSFVYLARELALQRLVAIKVLKTELAEEVETRKRFAREGRSMAKIRQRNVVSVHRVGEMEDGIPFIVMEYVPGRTLRDALEAQGAFAIDRAREVLAQVASALNAAHGEGIIHRDLRPENVLEEQDSGRIVLTDFGLAGLTPESAVTETKLTVQGQLLGNPTYSSPEQLQGEPVTEQTDTYSLGILGYELLTRQLPYEASTNVAMLTAHLQGDPTPLQTLRADIDGDLAALLERCLAKKPEQRPTASDLVQKLEVSVEPTGAHAVTTAPTAGPTSAFGLFQAELSRRHVGRVTLIYLGAGLAVVSALDSLLNSFDNVEFINRLAVYAYAIGLPITVVLAWVYDITSEGIKRTEESGGEVFSARLRLFKVGGLALMLVLAAALGFWFLR